VQPRLGVIATGRNLPMVSCGDGSDGMLSRESRETQEHARVGIWQCRLRLAVLELGPHLAVRWYPEATALSAS